MPASGTPPPAASRWPADVARVVRPAPQPFHPPVGISDETYPQNGRWYAIGVGVLVLLAAAIVAVLRP